MKYLCLMLFSIIIPSFLGNYKGAAKDRQTKIYRAMDSLQEQSMQDFETVFVADGCQDSYDRIVERYPSVKAYHIEKQPLLSGAVRNYGIMKAEGEYIAYLDTDDILGKNHLKKMAHGLSKTQYPDWAFFNDYVARKHGNPRERECHPDRIYQCGTSNVTHRRALNVWWGDGYLHDWNFIKALRAFPGTTIETPEYIVMHIPNKIDL